jgi:hypothetical protein
LGKGSKRRLQDEEGQMKQSVKYVIKGWCRSMAWGERGGGVEILTNRFSNIESNRKLLLKNPKNMNIGAEN